MTRQHSTITTGGLRLTRQQLILGVLCLGLLGVVIPQFLGGRGPSKAKAAPIAGQVEAHRTGPSSRAPGAEVRQVIEVAYGRNAQRDLFTFDMSAFERDPSADSGPSATSRGTGSGSDFSPHARLQQAIEGLELQGTILGEHPRALINGQLFGLGDQVRGLTVSEIQHRQISLERNGVTVRLEM